MCVCVCVVCWGGCVCVWFVAVCVCVWFVAVTEHPEHSWHGVAAE